MKLLRLSKNVLGTLPFQNGSLFIEVDIHRNTACSKLGEKATNAFKIEQAFRSRFSVFCLRERYCFHLIRLITNI